MNCFFFSFFPFFLSFYFYSFLPFGWSSHKILRVVFSSSVVYFHWLYFLFFLLITCKSAQRADGIVKKQGRAGKNIFFTYTTNTVLKYNSISPGFFSVPAGHQVLPTKQIYRKTVKSKLIGIITPCYVDVKHFLTNNNKK